LESDDCLSKNMMICQLLKILIIIRQLIKK